MVPKLLFINPTLRPFAKNKYSPVGLAYILTAVRKAGYDFDLIDMDADCLAVDDVKERLRGKRYDLCGLGCIVTGLGLARELAAVVREFNPDCCIVGGNSVASSIPRMLLERTEFDVAVLGEGDEIIVELIEAVAGCRSLSSIPGIAFLENGDYRQTGARPLIPDLDAIGFPDWSIFTMDKYNRAILPAMDSDDMQICLPLNGARGCPFNCTFCYHVFKGLPYRKYSEPVFVEEFARLHHTFGATFIYFWDELSFPNIPSVERLVSQLEKLPFRIGWQAISRADLFSAKDHSLLRRAREAGCRTIAFSIENASPEILKAMDKRISHDNTVEQSLALWKADITPGTSIIFGYPQETFASIKATLDLCEQCNIYPSVGYLQPLPGTPIYTWAVEHGHIPDEWDYLMNAGDRQDFHVNLTSIPTDELTDYVQTEMNALAARMGLHFDDPLKTGVYQKSQKDIKKSDN